MPASNAFFKGGPRMTNGAQRPHDWRATFQALWRLGLERPDDHLIKGVPPELRSCPSLKT